MRNSVRFFTLLIGLLVCISAQFSGAGEGGAVDVEVTGNALVVNEQKVIPEGVFGIHNLKLTDEKARKFGITLTRTIWNTWDQTPVVPGSGATYKDAHPKEAPPKAITMVLDCVMDRYQPALILEQKDWEKVLEKSARRYGKQAKETGFAHILEFWNEPYLNWASQPGVNYDGRFFEEKDRAEGGPMTMKTTGETFAYMHWVKRQMAVNTKNQLVDYLGTRYASKDYTRNGFSFLNGKKVPFKWEEGFKFDFRGRPLQIRTVWWGKDTTQKKYFSADFNCDLYNRMLNVYGKALKAENPDVKLIGGWDMNIFQEGWLGFPTLYQPTMDACIEVLDGITDHHYGSDTRMTTLAYEVVTSYARGVHGKTVQMYNTEAGGMADPEQPGNYRPNVSGDPSARARGAFAYFMRDVLHVLALSPDKLVTRAYHQPQHDPGGLKGFLFLKDLRGSLMEVRVRPGRVWSVASRQEDTLALYMWNDTYQARKDISVRIAAPSGMTFSSVERVTPTVEGEKVVLKPVAVTPSSSDLLDLKVNLPKRGAVKIICKLQDSPEAKRFPPQKTVTRKQFVLAHPEVNPETKRPKSNVRMMIKGDVSKTLEVEIPPAVLKDASRAYFRLGFWNYKPNASIVKINGVETKFDFKGEDFLAVAPLDLKLLKEGKNTVTFETKPDHRWMMATSSIVIESIGE